MAKGAFFIAVGMVLAVFRFLYTFFPYSLFLDLVVFALASFLLLRRQPDPRRVSALLLALPTMAMLAFFTAVVGRGLFDGVGAGNAAGLVVVPAAAFLGWLLATRRTWSSAASK